MSELENDEVGKCRIWLLSGCLMSDRQASELDFDVDPFYLHHLVQEIT